jgi:hypothetical protein
MVTTLAISQKWTKGKTTGEERPKKNKELNLVGRLGFKY